MASCNISVNGAVQMELVVYEYLALGLHPNCGEFVECFLAKCFPQSVVQPNGRKTSYLPENTYFLGKSILNKKNIKKNSVCI